VNWLKPIPVARVVESFLLTALNAAQRGPEKIPGYANLD
jgi:hypothetical protein